MGFTRFKTFHRKPEVATTTTGAITTSPNFPTTSALTTTPEPSTDTPQNLGSIMANNIDIRCKLEGIRSPKWAPKWCVSGDAPLLGILYFELQFVRPRNIPLEYAKLRIKLGQPINSHPAPYIDPCAPSNGISGPPMQHTSTKHSNLNPQFNINAGIGGGGLSIGERGTQQTSSPYRSWEFTSGPPSTATTTDMTDVEFTWTAGWEDDFDAFNRKFRTAIVVTREKLDRMAMSVEVEAKPGKGWDVGPPKQKRSGWLEAKHCIDEATFAKILDTLESDVTNAIDEMTPRALKPRWADQQEENLQQTTTPASMGLLSAPGMMMAPPFSTPCFILAETSQGSIPPQPAQSIQPATSQLPQASTGAVAV